MGTTYPAHEIRVHDTTLYASDEHRLVVGTREDPNGEHTVEAFAVENAGRLDHVIYFTVEPRFEHECVDDACTFLGWYEGSGVLDYDLYYCSHNGTIWTVWETDRSSVTSAIARGIGGGPYHAAVTLLDALGLPGATASTAQEPISGPGSDSPDPDPRDVEIARLRAALASTEAQWTADRQRIGEALREAAERQDWCSEYEDSVDMLNARLNREVLGWQREREFEVRATVTRTYAVTRTVMAYDAEGAEQAVRDGAVEFEPDEYDLTDSEFEITDVEEA